MFIMTSETHDMAIMLMGEKVNERVAEMRQTMKELSDLHKAHVSLINEALGVDIDKMIKDHYECVMTCSNRNALDPIAIHHFHKVSHPYAITYGRIIERSDKEKCTPSPILLKIYDKLGFMHPKFKE